METICGESKPSHSAVQLAKTLENPGFSPSPGPAVESWNVTDHGPATVHSHRSFARLRNSAGSSSFHDSSSGVALMPLQTSDQPFLASTSIHEQITSRSAQLIKMESVIAPFLRSWKLLDSRLLLCSQKELTDRWHVGFHFAPTIATVLRRNALPRYG